MKKLVLTVGNSMMGDDAAGPLLAQTLLGSPVDGWDVLDGGSAPENCVHLIREMTPDQILIIDAADMDLTPGEIRFIDAEKLDDPFLMSTHILPLSYLSESLREFSSKVDLIGIQPKVVAFGYPISPEVKAAVGRVHAWLQGGGKTLE
ncbi:MAG TPA: hydrogenase maturation peptidase HycI [Anaerolineales bacterium]|nr:hydrogenase maturation peptidase HycI [Anaerolineales bacterium]